MKHKTHLQTSHTALQDKLLTINHQQLISIYFEKVK
jgi:hypothetical protein